MTEDFDPVDVLSENASDLNYHVWGRWSCPDCTEQLPEFRDLILEAGISIDNFDYHEVQRDEDGDWEGELAEEYGITSIPTVVVEQDGREVARYVEELHGSEDESIGGYTARKLEQNAP